MSATIHILEDWTHGDPSEHVGQIDLARSRRIENVAAEIVRQFRAGHIVPRSPAACMAMVELEACRPVGVQ